ncbi:MAG: polyprenyl diphosphate synthase [Salinisphaeraceae bacterium]|nr:polyprenyl diphosphate synthase [Salinisphaeraceae bacterium]
MAQGEIASKETPNHVAIIMDGNGRWAQQRNKKRTAGHRAGARSVRSIIEETYRQGIPYLTVFAFSSENWKRPADEVSTLMDLFMRALRREIKELHENGVRLRFIGNRSDFAPALQYEMQQAEALTGKNDRLFAQVAMGYGGRWDIVEAAKRFAEQVKTGEQEAQSLNEADFSSLLSLGDCPDPDLLIRTGGESRISNFMLWQMAYTELYFTEVLWPDFSGVEYQKALAWFASRQRRFGAVLDGDQAGMQQAQ